MLDLGVNGVILRTKTNLPDAVRKRSVMGKTLEEWTASAIGAPCKTVECSPVINLVEKLRTVVTRSVPATVVLYGDTPLVSQRTIAAAVKRLTDNRLDVLELPRGCVYRTEYLFTAQSLFVQEQAPTDGEFFAVRDAEGLAHVTDVIRRRILRYHASGGVVIVDFANTHIDCDAVISPGVTVEPYNFIKGKTIIKAGAHIMPGNYIENCIIGANAVIDSSRLYDSLVGMDSRVGPFAYLRPNTVIGCRCRIGDFVEIKNSVIGDGCKVSHLTYIGDAELGKDCNVGCGVVFANYDGKSKYKTIVGNRVFIGSNSNLVAPLSVADCAFIAAGSTLTKDVPARALAIARARQSVIPDWNGNPYAPPNGIASGMKAYTPVQFADGIIDGEASANIGGATDNTGADDNNNQQ